MKRISESDKEWNVIQGHDEIDKSSHSLERHHVNIHQSHDVPMQEDSNIEIVESSRYDDSVYTSLPQSASFSKTSSIFSSNSRFSSEESLRSSSSHSSHYAGSKKVHSTLVKIRLGENKKISHDWYSDFTNQSQHMQASSSNSPLKIRVANASSQFEYDTHIAQMRGKFFTVLILLILIIKS
jgi:hypothetical protein